MRRFIAVVVAVTLLLQSESAFAHFVYYKQYQGFPVEGSIPLSDLPQEKGGLHAVVVGGGPGWSADHRQSGSSSWTGPLLRVVSSLPTGSARRQIGLPGGGGCGKVQQ